MGRLKPRYNEKARSSSRSDTQQLHPNARDGGIKALKRKYETAEVTGDQTDQRSLHIRTVLNIPTDVRLSSTKKKRLEKFIEKQLKKENRNCLMQNLSHSSIDSSLLVRSSSGISQGKVGVTEKERVSMEYMRTKAGLVTESSDLIVGQISSSDEEAYSSSDIELDEVKVGIPQVIEPVVKITQNRVTFGSALRKAAPKSQAEVIVPPQSSDEDSSRDEEIVIQQVDQQTDCAVIEPVVQESKVQQKYVLVERPDAIQEQRLQLPIMAEEHAIMELIFGTGDPQKAQDVVVLCGATGSGKSTQLPQFLYEAGYGNGSQEERGGLIAVTQPRRVAAISIAQRIGIELGMPQKVSHQVRYNSDVSPDTAIKVMTDGILLKEISNDLLLLKYSCIVIDEAHERSLNTDILIGFLSRVVPLRRKMFEEGKSQKQLGGKLDKVYPLKLVIKSATLRTEDFTDNQALFKLPPSQFSVEARQHPVSIHFSRQTPDDYIQAAFQKVVQIHMTLPAGDILVFLTGKQEILQLVDMLKEQFTESNDSYDDEKLNLKLLPLYAMQSAVEQMEIFKPQKPNQRLVVVSTNVAETSLTIPGVKYVVDSGRVKENDFDIATGVSSFKNTWTSKASADQRAGRAGRTGPGHVYRLYSSVVYDHQFSQFTKPEIQRMSIEGVVLQMKCMAIDNVQRFPFPSQPDKKQLDKSEKLLIQLGALDKVTGRITQHGRSMAEFPVAPRLACMIVNSKNDPHVLALVAMLTVGDPYAQVVDQKLVNLSKLHFSFGLHSDFLALVRMFVESQFHQDLSKFCTEKCLNIKVLLEARQLFSQLNRIADVKVQQLVQPDDLQLGSIRNVITESFKDQIALRVEKSNPNQKLTPYKLVSDTTNEQVLYLHPRSSLSHQEPPQIVVFQGLSKASQGPNQEEVSNKVYMVGVTALEHLPL